MNNVNPENIKQSIQAIIEGVTPLAQKMGVALEGLFGWAIKHNYAIGITNLIIEIIMIFYMVVYIRFAASLFKKDTHTDEEDILMALGAVVFVVIVIISFGLLEPTVTRFVAPEWMAMQDIIQLLK